MVFARNCCVARIPPKEAELVPVSRIEFVPESSVYWPIIGLGMRECGVAKRWCDPAVQSEFFLRVSHLKTCIAIKS